MEQCVVVLIRENKCGSFERAVDRLGLAIQSKAGPTIKGKNVYFFKLEDVAKVQEAAQKALILRSESAGMKKFCRDLMDKRLDPRLLPYGVMRDMSAAYFPDSSNKSVEDRANAVWGFLEILRGDWKTAANN